MSSFDFDLAMNSRLIEMTCVCFPLSCLFEKVPSSSFPSKWEFPFARAKGSAAMAIVQFRPNEKAKPNFFSGVGQGMVQSGQEKGQRVACLSLYSSWHKVAQGS